VIDRDGQSDEAARAEFVSACLALPGVAAVKDKLTDQETTKLLGDVCDFINGVEDDEEDSVN
jgi:hypothetical protein